MLGNHRSHVIEDGDSRLCLQSNGLLVLSLSFSRKSCLIKRRNLRTTERRKDLIVEEEGECLLLVIIEVFLSPNVLLSYDSSIVDHMSRCVTCTTLGEEGEDVVV